MQDHSFSVDVLAVGAHPDDVELSCGGSLKAIADAGKTTAIVDCTRGEMGSRGTPDLRAEEANRASEILGISYRENLGLEDGNIHINEESIRAVVSVIRKYRPTILLIPALSDRHLDHEDAARLLRKAVFASGLTKVETLHNASAQEPFRPKHVFSYIQSRHIEPSFLVDVTAAFSAKMQAIYCYESQVHTPGAQQSDFQYSKEPQTFISSPQFMEMVIARARYFGGLIGTQYAEGFVALDPMGISGLDVWLK